MFHQYSKVTIRAQPNKTHEQQKKHKQIQKHKVKMHCNAKKKNAS